MSICRGDPPWLPGWVGAVDVVVGTPPRSAVREEGRHGGLPLVRL